MLFLSILNLACNIRENKKNKINMKYYYFYG
jgi:hypothetical protein